MDKVFNSCSPPCAGPKMFSNIIQDFIFQTWCQHCPVFLILLLINVIKWNSLTRNHVLVLTTCCNNNAASTTKYNPHIRLLHIYVCQQHLAQHDWTCTVLSHYVSNWAASYLSVTAEALWVEACNVNTANALIKVHSSKMKQPRTHICMFLFHCFCA